MINWVSLTIIMWNYSDNIFIQDHRVFVNQHIVALYSYLNPATFKLNKYFF